MKQATWLPPLLLVLILIVAESYSFLLFHILAELFAIITAILLTVVTWKTYPFTKNCFLMYLGCGYSWVAALDLFHVLTYKGMLIYPNIATDPPTQLWIGARYLETLLLLTAPFFLTRTLNHKISFWTYGAIATAIYIAVMTGHFPATYLEESGLTPFKIYSEYLIITLLITAIGYLWYHRALLDKTIVKSMISAIVLTIAAEFCFTLYTDVYGISNFTGHVLKFISFWIVFIAVIHISLQKPFLAMARSANTYDAIPDATIVVDSTGKIRQVNNSACRLTKRPKEQLLGKACHDLFHDDKIRSEECPVCKAIIENTPFADYELSRLQGAQWFDISLSPIRDLEMPRGMVNVIRDITARKTAQHENSRLSQIIQSEPDMVAICNEQGMISYLNPAGRSLLQIEQNILPHNLSLYDIHPLDVVKTILHTGMAAAIEHGTWYTETELTRRNNEIIHCTYTLIAEAEEDKCYSFAIVARDITQQRQQEDALRRSQKMEALGKLTGGVAHDFNNLLSVIIGYAELLDSELNNEPKLKMLNKEVIQAGHRGAKLTKKLLAFSRDKTMQGDEVDLGKILDDASNMIQHTLTARIQLTITRQPDLWRCWMDSNDFEDALLNLSINAMQAIPDSQTGKLDITAHNLTITSPQPDHPNIQIGEYVELTVCDNGIGMDNEVKSKIFEPFFSTKNEKGTGLGLSQVYGFVKRAQGSIAVYSWPGEGTCFSLLFPRYQAHPIEEDNKDEASYQESLYGSETILIVDDEPTLCTLIRKNLERSGYQIFTANSGDEALELLDKHSIELMLCDVIMPKMDGYSLAEKVKQRFPNTAIQMMSGYSQLKNIENIDPVLQAHTLHKPFERPQLLQTVRHTLDAKRSSSNHIDKAPRFFGIEKVDNLRDGLLATIQELEIKLESYENLPIESECEQFISQCESYFAHENTLMKEQQIPQRDLQIHQEAHHFLTAELKSLCKSANSSNHEGLRSFFKDYLLDHFSSMDKMLLKQVQDNRETAHDTQNGEPLGSRDNNHEQ